MIVGRGVTPLGIMEVVLRSRVRVVLCVGANTNELPHVRARERREACVEVDFVATTLLKEDADVFRCVREGGRTVVVGVDPTQAAIQPRLDRIGGCGIVVRDQFSIDRGVESVLERKWFADTLPKPDLDSEIGG